MAKPDLTDYAQRAAYRRELRAYGRRWSRLGLTMLALSAVLLVWPRMGGPWMLGPLPMQRWGWGLLAVSWAILLTVIAARTRYHRQRMRE